MSHKSGRRNADSVHSFDRHATVALSWRTKKTLRPLTRQLRISFWRVFQFDKRNVIGAATCQLILCQSVTVGRYRAAVQATDHLTLNYING